MPVAENLEARGQTNRDNACGRRFSWPAASTVAEHATHSALILIDDDGGTRDVHLRLTHPKAPLSARPTSLDPDHASLLTLEPNALESKSVTIDFNY